MHIKGILTSVLLVVFVMFAMVPIAEAHVTVHPTESSTNAYEKYSVRIPVEKDINTTKVELQVPDGVDLVSVLPMDTWDYELKKDQDDRIKSVTWTANNGGIKPNEFVEFSFIGANPGEPGELSWDALQTYEDDSVVEWTGSSDSEEPASVTTVTEGNEVAPHGDNTSSDEGETAQQGSSSNWIPIVISSVALLLAIISIFRKKA